jgi:hypothetical protein
MSIGKKEITLKDGVCYVDSEGLEIKNTSGHTILITTDIPSKKKVWVFNRAKFLYDVFRPGRDELTLSRMKEHLAWADRHSTEPQRTIPFSPNWYDEVEAE